MSVANVEYGFVIKTTGVTVQVSLGIQKVPTPWTCVRRLIHATNSPDYNHNSVIYCSQAFI